MKKIILTLSIVLLSACASKEKVQNVDTALDKKGVINNGIIGLNDEGVAIIQKENAADQELRGLIWLNNQREMDLNHESYNLERCREEIADPRLGGSGDVVEIPEIDNMKPTYEIKKQLGLVNGNLVYVTKESFQQRMAAEESYGSAMDNITKQIKKHRRSCEIKMGIARRKAGLPSSRYQGNISVTSDGKVDRVLAPHEHNLDDAFRIKEENEAQKRAPAAIPKKVKDIPESMEFESQEP